ncbi:MAG TPA: creatininase family protein [Acidimicrobiia bacterium]|nr:creatininase family protein [Acidimicrobiia bacterium]
MPGDPRDERSGSGVYRWSEQAWPELGALTHTPEVGLVPVGATEQHGPHLPTGTDTIIASALCDAAGERTGAPVLPAVAIGCSYGHGTALPGQLSFSPELLAAVLREYALWAAASGLTRLLFVNAHFGNVGALLSATDELRLRRPDLRVGVANWWALDPVVSAEMTADGDDVHANRAETALMMHIAPEFVHLDRVADADDPDRTAPLVFRYTAPVLSTNGVTGRPSEATSDLGAKLFALTVDALVDRIIRGRVEEPPLAAPAFTPAPECS